MRKHKEKYEPLWRKTKPDAADSAASPEYNFEAYLVDLAKPDAWYSYLELHALANKCNIPIAILSEDADPIIINKEAAADATWCLLWVRDRHMAWLKGTPSDGLVTKLATKCHKAPYAGGRIGARTETCSEDSFRTASSRLRSLGRAPKPRTARSNATFRTVITKAKRSNNTCRTRSNLSQCLAQAPAPTFRTRSNISQCSSRTTVVKPRLSKGKRLSDRRNSGNFAKKMAASSQLAVAEPRVTGLKGHVGFRGADAHDSIFVRPLCDMTPAEISDAAARNYRGNVKRRGGMVLREWTCHICGFHVEDQKTMSGCSQQRLHHIDRYHPQQKRDFDYGQAGLLFTQPADEVPGKTPTWNCKFCNHVLLARPSTMIARTARRRHWKLMHPTKKWKDFAVPQANGHDRAQRLHIATRNAQTIRFIAARSSSEHSIALLRTQLWPWKGKHGSATVRRQSRSFWYCLACGQSSGTSGYIAGQHITKTPCRPCQKRANLKMSLRQWNERLQWLQTARDKSRLAPYVTDEAVMVARKLRTRASQLLEAAPVPRSTAYKERVGYKAKANGRACQKPRPQLKQ